MHKCTCKSLLLSGDVGNGDVVKYVILHCGPACLAPTVTGC